MRFDELNTELQKNAHNIFGYFGLQFLIPPPTSSYEKVLLFSQNFTKKMYVIWLNPDYSQLLAAKMREFRFFFLTLHRVDDGR